MKRLRKWLGIVCASASVGFLSYQTLDCLQRLRMPLNLRVLDKRDNCYIYISHDYFREPVKDFLIELFQEETLMYSFLYNVKKKVTFTKLEYALKTLRVAKHSTSTFQKNKAITKLCSSKLDLDDWEFQYLAQYCDAMTAVHLARNYCNPNLIKQPREFGKYRNKSQIINDIKNLFENIKSSPCVKFILDTTQAFEFMRDIDHDASPIDLHQENDHIIESLDHFVHLTNNPNHAIQIAENDGLEILSDIYKNFEDNTDIRMILAKIVTNMSSSSPEMVKYFHKSGWIYLLSNWQHDCDLRIQILASTGLSNLDKFDPHGFVYQPKVYPLYPRRKTNEKPEMDLIFVHGILGGIFITWRVQKESDIAPNKDQNQSVNIRNSFFQEEGLFKDEKIVQMEPGPTSKILTITEQTTQNVLRALHEMAEERLSNAELKLTRRILKHIVKKMNDQKYSFCWPIDWLPQEYPQIRILGLQFESALSYWVKKVCPCERDKLKLKYRSMDFLPRLAAAGVGGDDRPVVWVCHSMGGLIVKGIINQSLTSDDPNIRKIGENTKGIIFLGTPHKGSSIAKYSQQTGVLWPTIEVKDMEENSKELLKLNEEFLENLHKFKSPIEVVSVAEGSTMNVFQNIKMIVVPLQSAYLGFGDFFVSNENHLNLSKPLSQNSFIYLTVLNMLEKILRKNQKTDEN